MASSARRRRFLRGVDSRKDKTLQARIPELLDTELRNRADRLGLPVSTLVRNVLLHTFDLVEGIVTDGAEIARAIRRPAGSRASRSNPPDSSRSSEEHAPILAWQQVTLNVNAVCEECNVLLQRGTPAGIGTPVPARPVFLCLECISTLSARSR